MSTQQCTSAQVASCASTLVCCALDAASWCCGSSTTCGASRNLCYAKSPPAPPATPHPQGKRAAIAQGNIIIIAVVLAIVFLGLALALFFGSRYLAKRRKGQAAEAEAEAHDEARVASEELRTRGFRYTRSGDGKLKLAQVKGADKHFVDDPQARALSALGHSGAAAAAAPAEWPSSPNGAGAGSAKKPVRRVSGAGVGQPAARDMVFSDDFSDDDDVVVERAAR
jgi:hypothetical protein